MRGDRPRPGLLAPAAAAIMAGLIGVVIPSWLGPQREEIRAAASDLVPDGMTTTSTSENTGSTVIVGDYFAVVEFESQGSTPPEMVDAVATRAEELDWTMASPATAFGAATIVEYEREGLRAETRIVASRSPVGSVQVERDGGSVLRQRAVLGALGLVGGLMIGLALRKWRG